MKNLKYLLVSITLFFLSCDSNNVETNKKSSLPETGNWSLVKISQPRSATGISNTFPVGAISWSFNDIDKKVTIFNNNTNAALEDIFISGIYSYTITKNPTGGVCLENIKIDATDLGCYTLSGNKMTISDGFDDGFDLELIKQ